jgi:subtilisin-like proprotein convertase family protein
MEQLEERYLLANFPIYSGSSIGWIPEWDGPNVQPSGQSAALAVSPFPTSQTFKLHSRPGAEKIIYLDLDGLVLQDSLWNDPDPDNVGDEIPTIIVPPYSVDADGSFTNAELINIQQIWERVTEDFRPFDVDVTTEDPGSEVLDDNGIRVAIGGSNDVWLGQNVGGIAVIGSFGDGSGTPCFVFPDNVAMGDPKAVAEAASHEVGHTVGLYHKGLVVLGQQNPTEYYVGHGPGLGFPTGWAPIMGVGYGQELTQWSFGQYPNAVTMWPPEDPPVPRLDHQDELDVISMTLPYIPDDHGNDIASASELEFTGTSFFGEGVIEQNTDLDFFEFTIGVEEIVFDIRPFHLGPNLDILATLHDASGAVLATSNPRDDLNASFSINTLGGTLQLTPGAYYISIDGTGKVFTTDPGYTDYGSLGYFSITGTRKTLLDTLIGVDFDAPGGIKPANWTQYTGGGPAVFSDVTDEMGDITPYNLSISSSSGTMSSQSSTLNVNSIPFHTQPLAGVGGFISGSGDTWTFTWSDLEPLTVYEVYVFGANDAPGANHVEIVGNNNPISFTQSLATNDLAINGQTGSRTRPLIDYARTLQSSAAGTIKITVTPESEGAETGISGLAIRPGTFGSISGQKWNDENGDGIKDASESGLPGWTIFFDDNDNGLLDSTFATTIPSVDVPQDVGDYTTVKSELLFQGVREIFDLNVTLDISHTFDADVNVFLISPAGTRVELFTDIGGVQDNFTNVTLDDEASSPITSSFPPFTGTFRPEGLLSTFDGENANGIWILEVADDAEDDDGVLNSWSLTITGKEQSTTTNSSGNFSFEDLPPGVYNVKEVIDSGANTKVSADIPKSIPETTSPTGTTSQLAVQNVGTISDVNVNLDITHPQIWQLQLFLVSPTGKRVELVNNAGGISSLGSDFANVVFDDEATRPIATATAPFTGSYRPVSPLTTLDGDNANGTWTLEIRDPFVDFLNPSTGVLNRWSLTFSGGTPVTWVQTLGQPPVTVSSGGRVTGVNFGNRQGFSQPEPVSIGGQVWNDLDGNGAKDSGEPGLPDWTIYVDGNDNGQFDTAATRTVSSTAVPRTITDFDTVTSQLSFTGLNSVTDVDVTFDITHSFDGDLDVYLISPQGTQVELFSGVGGQFNNFTDTTLDQDAETSIADGAAPFTGTFIPEGLLSDFNGENPNGVWRLLIRDTADGDEGTLNSWSLTIAGQELFTTTDANGNYSFVDIVPGSYNLRQVVEPGWSQTHAPVTPIVVALSQQITDANFGNTEAPVALQGDYNLDDRVDTSDYVVWRKSMNQSVPPSTGADGDGDGQVDQDDYAIWRSNFGRSLPGAGGGASTSVSIAETGAVSAPAQGLPLLVSPGFAEVEVTEAIQEDASSEPFVAHGSSIATETTVASDRTRDHSASRSRLNAAARLNDDALLALLASRPADGAARESSDATSTLCGSAESDESSMLDSLDSAFEMLSSAALLA